MAWVRPTGYVDSENQWVNESCAYDNNTATWASGWVNPSSWGTFLELTHASFLCNKIKVYISNDIVGYPQTFDIDVYYSGAWHNIYQGNITDKTWTEFSLDATYSVTAMRIKSFNPTAEAIYTVVREVMFYECVLPTVTIQAVNPIGSITATGNGNITNIGEENCTKRGFQYKGEVDQKVITAATKENPCKITITDHGYTTGNTVIIFDVEGMTQLNGKTYVITRVNDNQFTLNDINSTGYGEYTSGGTCDKWIGTTLNVETTGSFGTGAFYKEIEELSPGTIYYIRAYAYNSIGYGYSIWAYFTTLKVAPTVTVQTPDDILPTTATANGNITASGGENATTRGFEYGLTQTATWDEHDNGAGSYGAGVYTKALTGLTANTSYWIRAYATNSIGTSYSAWLQFQTAAVGIIPTGTKINICSDYSGYTYQLQRSETDDGLPYTAYFVISTDLADKQGLSFYKRILDLHLYFRSEASGTAGIYVKRDSEADWQSVGSVALTGTEDIIIKHLACDIRAKHFLFKISAANMFRFLGCLFESIPEGMR